MIFTKYVYRNAYGQPFIVERVYDSFDKAIKDNYYQDGNMPDEFTYKNDYIEIKAEIIETFCYDIDIVVHHDDFSLTYHTKENYHVFFNRFKASV